MIVGFARPGGFSVGIVATAHGAGRCPRCGGEPERARRPFL
ncbi:MAG: hypothetical protein R3A10_04860 [Caldilineaceae bacterium]